jgi:molecular chaperone DnaK (HSP70)
VRHNGKDTGCFFRSNLTRKKHPVSFPQRFVGIDLGTTNCAVAWVDAASRSASPRPQIFEIPQLVAAGEIGRRGTLPSFLYFPTPDEIDAHQVTLPWTARPEVVAGTFAREQGALVPNRQIASAKSWLSNPFVDRRAQVLPWTPDAPERLSPVEASARLLAHLRDAWNHEHASSGRTHRLEDQEIVLTVPASFDEEARELTLEAARNAGLERLTLLEEPLAALYAWMAAHPREVSRRLSDGHLILVCDVGGGTSDFSLIRATTGEGDLRFERTAIGEHLLLGGDNLDLALAARLEARLVPPETGTPRLTIVQRQALRRACSAAKETLLADAAPDQVRLTILGSGRGVVGGASTTTLTRDDVRAALEEFLPQAPRDERPHRSSRAGLRELGLPYETDPAITRHLSAFLARAGRSGAGAAASGDDMARPDAVLCNGGFFAPPLARERILDALETWFGVRPDMLTTPSPEAAVAMGGAFYAALRARPEASRRLLVRAGSARAYYVGVQRDATVDATTAVCVMPRGTQEGTRLALERELTVITNQPAAFTLFSSLERTDALGDVVAFATGDDVHRHAALVTALRYGQRSRRVPLAVRLTVVFTEVGTLELWCESVTTEHRWRLQFNLRAAEADEAAGDTGEPEGEGDSDRILIPDESVLAAEALLRAVFTSAQGSPGTDALAGDLENVLGHGKHAWPLPVIRRLADVLLETSAGRRLSPRHEARWLNLAGFCLRPGFGAPVDPWRMTEIRKVYAADLAFPNDAQAQVEWLILWQRVAAGFTAAQQQELARRMIGLLGLGTRKAPRLNPQIVRDAWRLLGSLERLESAQRSRLGDELASRVRREPGNMALAWALGRFGARTSLYGPLNAVVPPEAAARWIETMLGLKALTPDARAALVQMAARTGDPARDVADAVRDRVRSRLQADGTPDELLRPLRELVPVERLDLARIFGETVPEGLRIRA